jgi:hypothetical protein
MSTLDGTMDNSHETYVNNNPYPIYAGDIINPDGTVHGLTEEKAAERMRQTRPVVCEWLQNSSEPFCVSHQCGALDPDQCHQDGCPHCHPDYDYSDVDVETERSTM